FAVRGINFSNLAAGIGGRSCHTHPDVPRQNVMVGGIEHGVHIDRSPFFSASCVVSAPLRKICVRSSKETFHRPPPKTFTTRRLRIRSTSRMVPPTSVVPPEGKGGGSRMGSWPLVERPPEVAELSRISVL